MEIKAKCKYDLDSVKALTHLTMFKKANPKKRMVFWTIIYAIVLASITLELIYFGMDSTLYVPLCVGILGIALIYFWYFFTPKIQYNALAKLKDVENEYIFCDNIFKAVTKSKEYTGEAEIEYSLFVRVYETSKYIFMYKTNNQAFLVDKSTITDGTIEEIKNKLQSYLKDKYVICKY